LTRNVTKEHLQEIFGAFGTIKVWLFFTKTPESFLPNLNCYLQNVTNPHDQMHGGSNLAYIEYSTPEEAENAMKHMDGGQIDGQVNHLSQSKFVELIVLFYFRKLLLHQCFI